MSLAQATALSFLMGQHRTEQKAIDDSKEVVKVEVSLNPPAPKVKEGEGETVRGKRNAETNNAKAAIVTAVTLPEKGTLDARGFLLTIRKAGERDFETQPGVFVKRIDPAHVRNDTVRAIAAYCGWDPRGNYGNQEAMARAKATREMQGRIGGLSRDEQRAKARAMVGTVGGLPDMMQRVMSNLLGQERKAADDMLAHERDAADMSRTEYERTLSAGLAEVERERIASIREEMARLG